MKIDNTILGVNALTMSSKNIVSIEAKVGFGIDHMLIFNLRFIDGSVQSITIVDKQVHIVA